MRKIESMMNADVQDFEQAVGETIWNVRLLAGIMQMTLQGQQRNAALHALVEELRTIVYEFAFTLGMESVAAKYRRRDAHAPSH